MRSFAGAQDDVVRNFFFFAFLGLLLLPLPGLAAPADIPAILANAREQTTRTLYYDPGYTSLAYPGGDVPIERGVCTDVVIRAFRKAGVDLQVLVHEDMRKNFAAYPKLWGLNKPDRSIDHRRVPNLMTFFKRRGKALAVTDRAADYRAGDVVAWRLPNGLLHIGLVSAETPFGAARPMIFHNIGQGAKLEDILFEYSVIGHYRYFQ